MIQLRGKGMPHLDRRGRGDLLLTVHVRTPTDLRREERQLLERMAELRGEPVGKHAVARGTMRRPSRRER